ncbi:MAG: DUF2461 domain-containing protein [Phyllobacteriaceae bacterium]|nr:DUF2461 domain-containing protein [Phyllobacteriaceae bacterium]
MSDGLNRLIAAARPILQALANNNTKETFEPLKPRFKAEVEAPAKLLAERFAEDVSRLTGTAHQDKVGRIYRDVRFSKNKAHYNTFIHVYWQAPEGGGSGWLLNITADEVNFMTGLHQMEGEALQTYRTAIDRDGDTLAGIVVEARKSGMTLFDWGDPFFKRVPKPYDDNHPHAGLLRRKQLIVGISLDEARLSAGLPAALSQAAQDLLSFWQWCNAAMR